MIISSEKANKRVRKIVDYAAMHRWAKYPGIAAVSVIYGADGLKSLALRAGDGIRESASAPFRPLAGRAASAFLAFAFAFMTVPVGITAGAEEPQNADLPPVGSESVWGGTQPGILDKISSEDNSAADGGSPETAVGAENISFAEAVNAQNGDNAVNTANTESTDAPENADNTVNTDNTGSAENTDNAETPRKRVTREIKRPKRKWMATTAEEIAGRVTMEGLPEYGEGYGITLNVSSLGRDVTAKFSSRREMIDRVRYCFECYDIPTDNLYIAPVSVSIYSTDDRTVLQFKEDRECSADITLPVPELYDGHTDDLKVVRLDDGNRLTVLDCDINEGEDGRTLTFSTEQFSVFAMIAYRQLPNDNGPGESGIAENIGSGSPVAAGGMQASAAVNMTISPFDEDKRRFGRKPGRKKVYRIKRICKEYEMLI